MVELLQYSIFNIKARGLAHCLLWLKIELRQSIRYLFLSTYGFRHIFHAVTDFVVPSVPPTTHTKTSPKKAKTQTVGWIFWWCATLCSCTFSRIVTNIQDDTGTIGLTRSLRNVRPLTNICKASVKWNHSLFKVLVFISNNLVGASYQLPLA